MDKNILVVDDDSTMLDALKEMLGAAGYEVTGAANGYQAQNLFVEKHFDLLISDIVMPDMNGVELVNRVRNMTPNTRVLMVSAHATDATKEKLKHLGVRTLLEKPIRMDALVGAVGRELDEAESNSRTRHLPRVLIADDNKVMLDALAEGLSRKGYQVSTATDGAVAYKKCKGDKFDIAVIDISMPKLNGIEAIEAMREKNVHTHIVVITGEADNNEVQRAMDVGGDQYLPKPFRLDELIERIERVDIRKIARSRGLGSRRTPRTMPKERQGRHASPRRRIASMPVATFSLIALLVAVLIFLFSMGTLDREEEQGVMDKVDRLIEAVEKDWGR